MNPAHQNDLHIAAQSLRLAPTTQQSFLRVSSAACTPSLAQSAQGMRMVHCGAKFPAARKDMVGYQEICRQRPVAVVGEASFVSLLPVVTVCMLAPPSRQIYDARRTAVWTISGRKASINAPSRCWVGSGDEWCMWHAGTWKPLQQASAPTMTCSVEIAQIACLTRSPRHTSRRTAPICAMLPRRRSAATASMRGAQVPSWHS